MENPIIFALGILAVIAIIIWRLSDLLFFRFRAKEAEGVIVNWLSTTEDGKKVFKPVIEFSANNKTHKYKADESCEGRPMYPIGTRVIVKYNPKKPKQVKTVYPSS